MFISDNASAVHEKVLKKIGEVNTGVAFPYGNDPWTRQAIENIRSLFGREDLEVFFVLNGTAANVVGLSSLLQSYESVLCAETTHIHTDECGALEKYIGAKIMTVPHQEGKITPASLEAHLQHRGNEHHNQPRVVSISQCTEMGAVYTLEEIRALAEFAHVHGMYLHMDGARVANAVVALGTSFQEMITDTGVDLLSFGGTKNGLLYGEAIVCLRPELAKNMKYIRKQGMQLLSKMRYLSAQFIAYLEEDLWRENAENANQQAARLCKALQEVPGVELLNGVDANIIFARFPQFLIDAMAGKDYFYVMNPRERQVRLVTSFATTDEQIAQFIGELQEAAKRGE